MNYFLQKSPQDIAFNQAISDEIIHQTMNGLISYRNPYTIKLKENFDSASWFYGPPHQIYLGKGLFGEEKDLALNIKGIRAYLRHEFCHYAWTTQDNDEIQRTLKESQASFQLWNLFEDARIEHLYREEFMENFGWSEFCPIPDIETTEKPEEFFLAIVQHEGPENITTTPRKPSLKTVYKKVERFYKAVCECKNMQDMLFVLKDWMHAFPRAQPQSGDLSLMMLVANANTEQEVQEAIGNFDSGCTFLGGMQVSNLNHKEPPKSGPKKRESTNQRIEREEKEMEDEKKSLLSEKLDLETLKSLKGSSQVLGAPSATWEVPEERVQKVANKLKKILMKGNAGTTRTSKDGGKRISSRHLAAKELRYQVPLPGKQKTLDLNLVFDCSGSMEGFAGDQGRILVAALNELAKEGLVKGNLILSIIESNEDGYKQELFQTIPFPFKIKNVPERIQYRGAGEGLMNAINENIKLIKKHQCLLVYTDADITDRDMDTSRLNSQGVFPIGLYVDPDKNYLNLSSKCMKNMMRHFKSYLIRENIESIAEAMAQRTSLLSQS